MKNILDNIIANKKQEVETLKKVTPFEFFKQGKFFNRSCLSLKNNLTDFYLSGIIAEFKQKSPSKGEINREAKVEDVTRGYSKAGATGLSVLTDYRYFGGSVFDLLKAREANPETPILRKDFMIDTYQIFEAKAFGADVVLLIAACLSNDQINCLALKAKELGLEVLLEIHDESELKKISPLVDLVGVNNRNLQTFEVSIETSIRLAKLIPANFTKISESGLSSPESIRQLKAAGYRGFLIGETFMKTDNPARACREFIEKI